jgi:hypothetical protein
MRIQLMIFLPLITAACGKPFWHPRPAASEPFPEPSSATAIQAISIEREPCMNTSCKAYRYTYHRDGRAIYDSLSPVNARLVQRARATLDPATFARLARAVLDRGFFQLQPVYSTGTTDVTVVTVRAVLPDTLKTVVEEEAIGPPALHEVQSLLDSIGGELSWQVVQRSN